MTRNMGSTDRVLRAAVGIGVFVLWATGVVSGTLAAVLGLLAVVFLATSLIGFCPLYAAMRISTTGRNGRAAQEHASGRIR